MTYLQERVSWSSYDEKENLLLLVLSYLEECLLLRISRQKLEQINLSEAHPTEIAVEESYFKHICD